MLRSSVNIKRDYLIKSLPFFEKLQTLEFSLINNTNCDDYIAECINLCHNLKKLTLSVMTSYSQENVMNSIIGLKKIESLTINHVKNDALTKNFFNYIGCNLLELKNLDLSYNGFLSDADLKSLNELKKLEYLNIYSFREISGSELGDFPNLKQLHCRYCINLEDEFLVRQLRCAKKLEYINMSHCKKISTSVLRVAIEETKKRTNDIVLEMEIYNTRININEVHEVSPRLHLVHVDED